MNPELEKCYDAFERLKKGRGTHEKCKTLPLAEVPFAKISLEAGYNAGHLKKNRTQHKALLLMLEWFQEELHKNNSHRRQ